MFPPAPYVIVIQIQNSEMRVYCLKPRQHLLKVTKKDSVNIFFAYLVQRKLKCCYLKTYLA